MPPLSMAEKPLPLPAFRAVEWDETANCLILLDQTELPNEVRYLRTTTPEAVFEAIRRLAVRGAPAIGLAGAYGFYLTAAHNRSADGEALLGELKKTRALLASARPTAVNLAWALDRMWRVANQPQLASPEDIRAALLREARKIEREDADACQMLGENGLQLLRPGMGLLTHCNAGALATARYGTALAPIYLGQERGYAFKVYADETRPLLQGARLTAWELHRAGVDVTLICDNMAAAAMQKGWIDAVLIGCDRVAANGDAANKIGSTGLARLAGSFGIPFYVFAPTSTIDLACPTGEAIPIEERADHEVTRLWYEKPMAPEGVKIWNPAFDVVPAEWITAIVTEAGIWRPPYGRETAPRAV